MYKFNPPYSSHFLNIRETVYQKSIVVSTNTVIYFVVSAGEYLYR